jgi:hypothetical protein
VTDDALTVRGGERDTLTGFLDWYRAVVAGKVRDLRIEDAIRVAARSGLSPLGAGSASASPTRTWTCRSRTTTTPSNSAWHRS